jgi:hypothetical protein
MARNVVDLILLEVAVPGSQRVDLQEVMSFDVTQTNAGAEAVKTMRQKRRAIGFKRGVPDFEIDMEVKPVTPPEVDWGELERKGTLFSMFYEENSGGRRFRLTDCLVTEVGKTGNAEGEVTQTVKILALDHRLEL